MGALARERRFFVRRVGGYEGVAFVVGLVTVVGDEGGKRKEQEGRGGGGVFIQIPTSGQQCASGMLAVGKVFCGPYARVALLTPQQLPESLPVCLNN